MPLQETDRDSAAWTRSGARQKDKRAEQTERAEDMERPSTSREGAIQSEIGGARGPAEKANFLPLNECVDWTKSFDEIIDRIEDSEPQFSYLIVPVFVYSSLMTMNDQEQTQVISFLKTCHEMTGIYPTIIITNKSRKDPREMAEKFRLMGAGKVFMVENYTMEDHLPSRGRHTNMLDIIKNALEDVNFLMESERNPHQDRKAFKKRLIKMAHENVLAKTKQEEEKKQKALERKIEQLENRICLGPLHSLFRRSDYWK